MSRRLLHAVVALGLVLGGLTAAPVVTAGDPCFHDVSPGSRPAPTTGASIAIAIGDCVFSPTVSHVPVGAEVTWRNASGQAHEVVGANLAWGAHKKMLHPGDSIGWTFAEPGVYPYSCMVHPGMTGAIVVGQGVAAAAPVDDAQAGGANEATADASPAASTEGAPVGAVAAAAAGVTIALAGWLLLRRRQPSAA